MDIKCFRAGDAVLLIIPVMKDREIVMDLMMEVSMMVMMDVKEILCVAATTVESLEATIMRKMIAVRNHQKLEKKL